VPLALWLLTAAVGFDPGAINNPGLKDTTGPGASGNAVVRAQILLNRAHFSSGEIDGEYGNNLAKAVTAYRGTHGLPAGDSVDAAVWAALDADTAPALVPYTIANDDVAGPFVKIPNDMMQMASLPALGYQSPAELLGEKFHAGPKLLAALNPDRDLGRAGENIVVPNVLVMPPGKAASVVVSKSASAVTAYDANGKLLAFYAATIGSEHDPLPLGNWKIPGVQRNPWFHYNAELFWDAHNPGEKAKIAPGPNNPVGMVWIDLSKEHYGIHGTPEPSQVGHRASHGCIRLTNWDAAELAGMVRPGIPAVLKE
jgi:lipoprotein-anchoring transpeptidase ErfK/SrfK